MRLDDYSEKDGKRVWLTSDEMELLIDEAQNAEQRIAFTLGGKAGLRRGEIVKVRPADFMNAPDGFVRVWGDYAKKDKYREAPIPKDFGAFIDGVTQGQAADRPVVDVHPSSVYKWVRRAAERLQAESGDRGWSFVGPHDLRRSWGGHLLWNCGVSPMSVMQFGGWEDWDTFSEHYMGEMTPEAMERERGKIDYMGGEPSAEVVFEPTTPAAKSTYGGQKYNS